MSPCALLWFLALGLCCHYGSTFDFNFTHSDPSQIHNLTEYCKNNEVCFVKCCPEKYIMVYGTEEDHTCKSSSELRRKYGVVNPDDYSDIEVYAKDIEREQVKTKKSVNEFKFIYLNNFTGIAGYVGSFEGLPQFRTYILEDGKWVLRRVNYWDQWDIYEPGQFCIDHEVSLYEDDTLESLTPSIVVWVITKEKAPTNTRAIFGASAMLVSCFFLSLMLAVYALLPQLRNMAGLMLMACMATYFAFFIIRIIQVFANENQSLPMSGCSTLTVMFYYLMLATFCWINVMSFDIWWKFRSIRKSHPINRRGVMNKFRCYCAYAWGLPVLPTLFVVIVDNLDLTHIPNFVKPHIFDNACFFEKDVHFLYVGIPILVLNCVNLLLFLMTAFNIWDVRRGVSRYNCKDSTNNKKDENRFWVYLKLFTVMGVSWLLEVLSDVVHVESLWWCVSDLYNCLVGFLIFILFVCKKNIILQLCTRFSIDNQLVGRMRRGADARAPDAHTKSSGSQHTDASDVDWTPSYKTIQSKSTDI